MANLANVTRLIELCRLRYGGRPTRELYDQNVLALCGLAEELVAWAEDRRDIAAYLALQAERDALAAQLAARRAA